MCDTSSVASPEGSSILQLRRSQTSLHAPVRTMQPITEGQWQTNQNKCCMKDTATFVRLLLDELGLEVCDEGCHNGEIPFYDCQPSLTLTDVKASIIANVESDCPCWSLIGTCQPLSSYCPRGSYDSDWIGYKSCQSASTTGPLPRPSVSTTVAAAVPAETCPGPDSDYSSPGWKWDAECVRRSDSSGVHVLMRNGNNPVECARACEEEARGVTGCCYWKLKPKAKSAIAPNLQWGGTCKFYAGISSPANPQAGGRWVNIGKNGIFCTEGGPTV
jgi:hypothetical protein